jgi:hypothetical protein
VEGRFKPGIYMVPSREFPPGIIFRVRRTESGHWTCCPIDESGQPNGCGGPLRRAEWARMEPRDDLVHLEEERSSPAPPMGA